MTAGLGSYLLSDVQHVKKAEVYLLGSWVAHPKPPAPRKRTWKSTPVNRELIRSQRGIEMNGAIIGSAASGEESSKGRCQPKQVPKHFQVPKPAMRLATVAPC